MKHRKIATSESSIYYDHLKHKETQREGIHQLHNQMLHLSHLKFKLDLLVIPNGVAILWTSYFGACTPTRWRTHFLFEKDLYF